MTQREDYERKHESFVAEDKNWIMYGYDAGFAEGQASRDEEGWKKAWQESTDREIEKDKRIAELEAQLKELLDSDSALDKVLTMTDEQVSALIRTEGRSPDDVSTIGKLCFDKAKLTVRIKELEARLAAWEAETSVPNVELRGAHGNR